MKRTALCISMLMLALLFVPMQVHAQEPAYDDTLHALLESTGVEDMLAEQGLEGVLDSYGISPEEPETAASLEGVLGDILAQTAAAAGEPIRILVLLLGVILLSALAESLQSRRTETAAVCETVCVLCAVGVMAAPLSQVFLQAAEMLQASAAFMLSFSAVFAAVLTVSGGITAAAGYQGMMAVVCEIAMQIAVHFLFPLLSMGLAMSIVDAVNPAISLEGIVKLVHKLTVWVLGFLMSVFLALLSVQSMMSLSADRLTSRTTKYVISSFVPFVGSAVSDAYATVLGSMGVLKSTTGVIGIAAVLSLLLPILIRLGVYRMVAAAAAAAAELFAVQRLARLLKNMECVLATAFSVAVSFSVMFIVSTAIMMLLGNSMASGS